MQIKVMSWNIWHGKYLPEIKEHLKTSNPDIVGLQEVMEMDKDRARWNLAGELAAELGYDWCYYKAYTTDRHEPVYDQGNAVLSKFKIINSTCHFLSDLSLYKNTAETEPRIAVACELQVGSKILNFITTHLAYSFQFGPSDIRHLQTENLLNIIHPENTVLTGDFNTPVASDVLRNISHVLPNADKNPVQPTWTIYPFNYQGHIESQLKHRLDNIFVSPDILVKKCEVEKSQGSDHLPVSAIIEF